MTRISRRTVLPACFALFVFTAAVTIFGLFVIWNTHAGVKIGHIPYAEASGGSFGIWEAASSGSERREMIAALQNDPEAEIIFDIAASTREKHLALMRFVMNRYAKVGPSGLKTPYQIFKSADLRDSPGVLCSDLAALLAELSTVTGSKARVMSFQTGFLERYDSHTAVELWEDERWVLYDPTFNMTFKNAEGRLLDSLTLRRLTQMPGAVLYEFHGEVAFPTRLESYYIAYPLLLRVISVSRPHLENSFVEKILPPLRYFLGPEQIVLVEDGMEARIMDASKFHQQMYRLFCLILPGLCLTEALIIAVLWRRSGSRARR